MSKFDRTTALQGTEFVEVARRATAADAAMLTLVNLEAQQTLTCPTARDGIDQRHANLLLIEAMLYSVETLLNGRARVLLQRPNGQTITAKEFIGEVGVQNMSKG